jgi:crotonobetainyl-CoA:carnitine CoA-transferase CaiB-like acyl-CoA transferase
MIAGTYGGMLLADFGADVIKVEAPSGDIGRNPGVSAIGGHSGLFLTMNRGKRSVVIDLKSEHGRALFLDMVVAADVVVANFRPGVLERLRIDYDALRAVNPGIILCDISGFGTETPSPQPPSFDLTHQAMGGLLAVTGDVGGAPVRVGIPIADMGVALFATLGILSALVGRAADGVGSKVEIAMLETTSFLLGYDATMFLNTGVEPRAFGTAHAYSVPWQAFETADGWLVVAVREEKFWRAYCGLVGLPELIDDPRFASNAARILARDELVPLLEDRMRTRTSTEWLVVLGDEVPVAPVRTVAQALARSDEAGAVVDVPYEPLGHVRMLRNPVRFDGAAQRYGAPPSLGEHTAEVLGELAGRSEEDVAALVEQHVVRTHTSGR